MKNLWKRFKEEVIDVYLWGWQNSRRKFYIAAAQILFLCFVAWTVSKWN